MREPVRDSNKSRIFSRSRKAYISGVPSAPMSCKRNPIQAGVIDQARQFARMTRMYSARSGGCNPASFSTLRRRPSCWSSSRCNPAGRCREWSRGNCFLGDFFVIAMQVAENRLELDHRFAVQHDIHPKHPVRGGMLRPHRDFQQMVHPHPVTWLIRSEPALAFGIMVLGDALMPAFPG
jgi:hypothetical protein